MGLIGLVDLVSWSNHSTQESAHKIRVDWLIIFPTLIEGDGWSGKGYHWWDQVYKMTESGFSTNKIVYLAIGTDDREAIQ